MGTVVGVGCAALTVGWGSVACAVAGGALASAITNTIRQSNSGKPFSWGSFATETAIGGVFGAVGLGVGAVASRWIAPVANRAVQGAVSAVRASTSKGGQAVASAARGVVNKAKASVAQVVRTKPIQASTPRPQMATGGASNARPGGPSSSSCLRPMSFAAGTGVLMADGSTKKIEKVTEGDQVASVDPTKGQGSGQEAGSGEVVATLVHDDVMVTLVVAGQSITTTEDHPFWSVTDQRFERADELEAGEAVLTATGATATVDGIDLSNTIYAPAYNLTVTSNHTYYVLAGDAPVLVHNCGGAQSLADRASEIHAQAGSDIAMSRSTVAVVSAQTPEGVVNVVAGSGRGLSGAQKQMLGGIEVPARNILGTHAEQNAILFINEMGWSPIAGGAARSVCSETCAPLIRAAGGRITGRVYQNESGTMIRTFEWLS